MMSLRIQEFLFKVLCRGSKNTPCINTSCIPTLFSLNTSRRIFTYQEIPRAPRIPVLGSLPYFVKAGGQTNLHNYVDNHHKNLGPIFIDNLGGGDIVFVSDPAANIKVYAAEGPFPQHYVVEAWKLFLEETGRKRGLFFMDGEEWYNSRTVLTKLMLRPDSMVNYVQSIAAVCKDFMDVWKVNPPNHLEYQLYCWNIECIAEMALGKRLGFFEKLKQDDDSTPMKHTKEDKFVKAIYSIFLETANLYVWPAKLARNLRIKPWKRFYSAVEAALDCGENYAREAIRDCRQKNPSENIKQSVLYKLLDEQRLSDDTIVHVFTDLIMASTDTTSHAACWTLYLLGKNPKIADAARKQIFSVLEKEKTLTLATLSKIPYVNGILRETLRLYPIAPFLTRKLAIDTDLYDYSVPAGAMVISSLFSMGRDPTNFEDPEVFRPERWFNKRKRGACKETETAHVRQAYIPFGLGGRSCIGRRTAELELSFLIIEALQAFEWTVEEDVDVILRMVTVPSKEVKLKLTPL